MILYFADTNLNIIGNASTELSSSYLIIDDKKTEDVDLGVSSFEGKIFFEEGDRIAVESLVSGGNYIFRYEPTEVNPTEESKDSDKGTALNPKERYSINGFRDVFTIIETEIDTKSQTIYFYAEDAGLNLNNNLVGSASGQNLPIQSYVNMTLVNTGFILKNEIVDVDDKRLSLEWTDNQTVTARLQDIAAAFEFEFSFGFDIIGMEIVSKWVEFVKERGHETNQIVTINRRVDNIVVKSSIANLATSLLAIGADDLTLDGYNWDDGQGDFHTSGLYLMSEKARNKWAGKTGHISRVFSCDATTKIDLKDQALAELKKRIEPEVNYDVDVVVLPDGVGIGDRINVVDDNAGLYISGRILKLVTSVTNTQRQVTLGEWKIKTAGIASTVMDLAAAFKTLADRGTFYTWIAYAKDNQGTDISTNPYGMTWMGVAPNQTSPDVDISDPSIFSWVEIQSEGVLAVSINITSSNGAVFIDNYINTTLTAHIFLNGTELSPAAVSDIGDVWWYDLDDMSTRLNSQSSLTYTISAQSEQIATNITAQLETRGA